MDSLSTPPFPPIGEANSHIKMTGVLVAPFRGKNEVLLAFRLFRLKRSTAGTFAMPFRILSRKKMAGDNVLCKNWDSLMGETISNHAHKTGSWYMYLLGDLIGIKIFEEHPRPSYICVLLPRGPRRCLHFAKRRRSTNRNYLNKRRGVY